MEPCAERSPAEAHPLDTERYGSEEPCQSANEDTEPYRREEARQGALPDTEPYEAMSPVAADSEWASKTAAAP